MFYCIRQWRRKRLTKKPLPDSWREIIDEELDYVEDFGDEEREHFLRHLKVFVWEKHWIGAKDLEVTEEMKVVIGGAAARIARCLPIDVYDRLTEVVVYESDYVHPDTEQRRVYGEAHHWGTVVLSWDAVQRGLVNPVDAHDTAIHEFAHALDIADGRFDGTPVLGHYEDYQTWASVLGEHFSKLQRHRLTDILDEYGATNEAEFFAVATEAFFERPKGLRRKAPELYDTLSDFFRVDPASSK
jgi:hypothetical protein